MSHNYGLENLKTYLMSRNYLWSEKEHKKVILVNVNECKDKITLTGLVKALKGTGYLEWEALLASWLTIAVINAIKNGEDTADITRMFSRELSAYDAIGKQTFPHDKHVDLLMKRLFEKVEESADELKVKLVKIV